MTFRHSGESIILGRNERTKQWTYYYFRAAPGDDPIEWGFSYNPAAAEERLRIKKDQKDTERDDLVNRALEAPGGAGGTKIQYREHSPAYFSDITLFLTRGGPVGSDGHLQDHEGEVLCHLGPDDGATTVKGDQMADTRRPLLGERHPGG